jgi:hypothetical protein
MLQTGDIDAIVLDGGPPTAALVVCRRVNPMCQSLGSNATPHFGHVPVLVGSPGDGENAPVDLCIKII